MPAAPPLQSRVACVSAAPDAVAHRTWHGVRACLFALMPPARDGGPGGLMPPARGVSACLAEDGDGRVAGPVRCAVSGLALFDPPWAKLAGCPGHAPLQLPREPPPPPPPPPGPGAPPPPPPPRQMLRAVDAGMAVIRPICRGLAAFAAK